MLQLAIFTMNTDAVRCTFIFLTFCTVLPTNKRKKYKFFFRLVTQVLRQKYMPGLSRGCQVACADRSAACLLPPTIGRTPDFLYPTTIPTCFTIICH